MEEKVNKLKEIISNYPDLIVGFSGGIDSTLLCYLGHQLLKNNFLAITASSKTLTKEELQETEKLTAKYNWNHLIIETDELENKDFTKNTPDKCKFCKEIRFKKLLEFAQKENFLVVASGDNVDDLADYRPGLKQAHSMGIKSPLIEAGFTKKEIRQLAKDIGLPNYDKPSNPCLASRIPYGIEITIDALNKIDQSENLLQSLGYKIARVRHHNDLARIEIETSKIMDFSLNHSKLVVEKLKQIGYKYVCIDLEGYRTGSLNEGLMKNNG